jgi:hypothetical protein
MTTRRSCGHEREAQELSSEDVRQTRLKPEIVDWIETIAILTISALIMFVAADLLCPRLWESIQRLKPDSSADGWPLLNAYARGAALAAHTPRT